jgi:hypothetical protein
MCRAAMKRPGAEGRRASPCLSLADDAECRRPRTNRIEARVFRKEKARRQGIRAGQSMLDRADSPLQSNVVGPRVNLWPLLFLT